MAPYPWLVSIAVTDRPVLAGVLGALVIAFSGILVRLAEVSPSTAAFFRCAYALPVLVLLALSSQVLGWLLISVSLPRLPAVLTSIVLMLQPVCTVLLGALLLSEAPSAVQLTGVAIVIAGVAVATVKVREREPAPV
jgi:drug/metabolite transporter (DMT)-like permease